MAGPGRQSLVLPAGAVPEFIEGTAADYPQLPAVWVERLVGQEAPFVIEVTQFFLAPGGQRRGRPREVIHRCRDADLDRRRMPTPPVGQDDGAVLNRSVIPGYRDSDMTWALTGRSPDAGTRYPGPDSSVRTSAARSAFGS